MRRVIWGTLVLVVVLVAAVPAAADAPFVESERPRGVVGSDGAMWTATDSDPLVLERRTVDGSTSTVEVPTIENAQFLAPGIDGDPVWGASGNEVFRIGADGSAATFSLPEGRRVAQLAPAGDGRRMWFLGGTSESSWLGTVEPSGDVELRTIQIPKGREDQLTAAASGALWSSPGDQGVLRRIADDSTVRLVDVEGAVQGAPAVLADGTLWVAVVRDGRPLALRLRTDDTVAATVELPTTGTSAVVGPEDAVWFETDRGYLRLTDDGRVLPVLSTARGTEWAPTPERTTAFAGDLWYRSGNPRDDGRLELADPFPAVDAEVVEPVGPDGSTTIAVEVSGAAGTPSGTVEVVDYQCCHHGYWNYEVLGSATLDSEGWARITVTPYLQRILQSKHFHVDYAGDDTYPGNTSVDVAYEGTPPSDTERYIAQVYEDLLDRFPEDAGLAYWTGELDRGTPRTAVSHALAISEEHRERLVEGLFRAYLDREAEGAGRDSFVADLARGATINQIRASVLGSDEYFVRIGGGSVDGFIDALYQEVLGRDPDSAGRAFWRSELASGVTKPTMASALLASIEALERLVGDHFERLLRRDVDATARTYWAGLLRSGFREERLLAELIGSDEYHVHAILEHW